MTHDPEPDDGAPEPGDRADRPGAHEPEPDDRADRADRADRPGAHEPDDRADRPGAGDTEPGSELADAVEAALHPAKHDAVMALWQQVVLGRLDRDRPRSEDEDLLRRFYEGERPEDPPPS